MEGKIEAADPKEIDVREMPPYVLLETSLMEELKRLSPPVSPRRCIYRVPDRFRRVRNQQEYYTPRIISIGPFHHGKEALKAMEDHKMRYLERFLARTGSKLNECIRKVNAKETELRSCYAESFNNLNSDEFLKIILVDAIFLVEFLHRWPFGDQSQQDCIFGKPMMVDDLVPDLLMLENQLPFFILEDLYGSAIKRLSLKFVCVQCETDFGIKLCDDANSELAAEAGEHFVDLYRKLLIAPIFKGKEIPSKKEKLVTAPSIEKLHQAGVQFKVIEESTNLFGIQFDKSGVLEIPKLKTGDSTELVLRNLIAFEQCSDTSKDYCISDYVTIMDELVNTSKDVELLVKNKIIENNLGGADHELSSLINSLSTGIKYNQHKFYYGDLCGKLHKFYYSKWHKWMANLRRNYFNTPWAIISFAAAVVLLVFTATQTICSLNSLKY